MAAVVSSLTTTNPCCDGHLGSVPKGMEIRFLADRGFADTRLLDYLTQQLVTKERRFGFITVKSARNTSPRIKFR